MCHLLKFDGLFHTKLFCFRVNHPRFFRTRQINIMNVRIFRHFSLQLVSLRYHQYLMSFQNSSSPPPNKNCSTKDLQKPTCYTKVPKLAPLVDVQRIPKFGYLSQTTGCDMTHPGGNPSLNDGGKPPERSCWGALGLKRIQHLLLSSVAWWVGQWWDWGSEWDIGEINVFFMFLDLSEKKIRRVQEKTLFLPTLASFLVTRNICFHCFVSFVFSANPWFFPTSTASNGAWA